ncbi:hypothetical protein L211DRAFT_797138 [Terfezia boudieri ATCC MYA-4762]|uniref:DUF6532 domain-containing protein n=1 Tax=Terfezia boudieri ATCC MYA-4762 TaxID=1051890 RepID=A0A3N4LA82_9PEZI|nr:hypothetical protein L211DRAFT_797138 [Terfezia boudieri ATCC MYA-4762]
MLILLAEKKFRGRFRAEEIINIIYQWYFQGAKMKGNRDLSFLDRINGVFIYFVTSAMHHSLKAWRTEDCNPVIQEFKYETACVSYNKEQRETMTNVKQAFMRG